MIKKTLLASALSLSLLALGVPAIAHHSANSQFDTSQEFVLTGVLIQLDDVNPHSMWHVDVKAADGTVTAWRLEGVSPNSLRRLGLSIKNDLKFGGTYSFTCAPSRDGSKSAFLKAVTVNGKLFQMVQL